MALINYCDYEIKGTLTVGGIITAPGGTSTEWNTSYDNMVAGIAFSGTTTKTLTLTQQDGGVLTASFTDNNDNTNYYTTTATFNTSNGIISFSGAGGQPAYSVDIDGRYALSSVVSGVTSINFKTDGTALNVASNTITTSGTMTGVWQGTSSQYVNGEGDLITFPSVAGTYNFDLTGDSGTSATVTSGSTVSIIGSSTISTTSNGFNVSIEATTAAVANGGTALASGDQIYDFVIGQLPSVNNNTITLSAGTGLSGGGAFTLNQSSNETITFNNSITNNNQLTNGSGYITASSTDTLTNKSGNISQWTNDSGYTTNVGDITAVTAGSGLTGGGTSGSVSLAVGAGTLIDVTSTAVNVDLSELSQATGDMISTDYFVITLAGGTQYKTIPGNVPNNLFPNDAGYTTNVGDITGVTAGNKLTGGGTSGTVTLGLASDNISQWTNDSGYTTNVGDITAVTVTAPITGGGTSGSVGIGITQATTSANGYLSSTDWNTFNNKTGNTGDITGVTAGTNLTGGGTSGSVTLNMATGGAGAASYGSTSDSIKIDTITLDAYGRVTAVATGATGQVNTVATGNSSTLTSSGTTAKTLTPVTATVNASSAALATGAQIQTAINSALTGVLQFEGTWNASTNSPSLSSGTGTSGDYYIVSVAGSTNLDGITDWEIGDWAVFANTTWTKIDNSQVGNVTGSGSSGRVAYWNSSSNITSSGNMTFNGANLGVSGVMTAFGGNSTEWNTAYDNQVTAFSDSGSSTITLTLTQQDGGTLTTSFSNPQGTVTDVTGTSPVVSSGGTTPAISMPAASGSVSGYLTSTNWTTFNNKTGNLGTVTSVTVSGSSGISGSGTITTSGSIGLTNSDKGSSQNIFKNVLSDSGTAVADNNNDTLSIVGGTNVSTAVVGDVLTITATDTTTNNYVTGASQSGGTLTLTRTGLSTLTATGFTNATNTQTFTNKSGSNSQWTNDEGYITSAGNQGTVTSVATGSGLTGGTITTSGTLSHADTSSQATVNNSGNTYIQDVTLDTFGHVTGLVSSTTTLGGLGFTGATNANYITNNNQISNGEGYTTNTGTTTASNTQTFTNKSGNISQWTNNSGYITSYVDTNNYVTGGNVTSGTVTLTRTGLSNVSFAINNSQITNGMGFTTNTGTTTAGNTQTFTGKSGNISQWTNDSGYSTTTGTVTPSSTDTFTNKSGNISQWTNNSGYVTSSGNTTIGTSTNIGISAGGAVLSTVSLTQGVITAFTTRTMTLANLGYTGATNANYITNNNQLTNGSGYTTNTGTVTSVGLSIDTNDALDVSNTPVTSSGTIALEWQGDGATVVLGSGELADWPPNQQTQFTSNFLDSSSSTSYFYIPFNSTSESTSSQYYNHLACAQNGTVKKIMMMHTSGAASTSFTTQLRVVKNGVTAATSGELTPSNGANDGSYVEYLPSTTFVKGDRIRIGYQKSATSKYWQGVSAIVIFEFTPV